MPAYPLRRQTVRLGGLTASELRPQAGAAGDAAPQPGKRIPAPAVRRQVWPWGGKEERKENADLPLKPRVALLGAALKAQLGAGESGGSPGVPKCGARFSSQRAGCIQARAGGIKCPDQCSATRQEGVTRLSLLFNVAFGQSDTV